MLRALRKLLDKRKERARMKAYRAGYIWASQELSKGVPAEEIEAFTHGQIDWFNRGANHFLRDHFIREANARRGTP